MTDHDDLIMLGWFCVNLAQLRADADSGGWRPELDSAEAELRAGASAVEVCRRLGYPVDIAQLRAPAPGSGLQNLRNLGVRPVPVTGDYVCPHGRCGRREQPDRQGREPLCANGTPMLLSADQPGRP
jgi:hypothetical protein